jgi:hypothetical protein
VNQLIATARNIRHFYIEANGEIEPEIEAVLTTRGKHKEFLGPSMATAERLETIRFAMTVEAAEIFAGHLLEWAKEARAQVENINNPKRRRGRK